jgi:antitoxin (DNA-binding transcriptional repressor) of toxin-antitoxin stability system
VKRLAAGKTITVTVRGVPFVLEVGAGANAKGVAEAFERAKAAA